MLSVVITAGGTSTRFKNGNKLFFKLGNETVIEKTVKVFLKLENIDEIIISANLSIIEELKSIYKNVSKVKIIEGGATRQESVYKGLKACNDCSFVIIHDGARPFIKEETIINCLNKARETKAAIVAVKTTDTVKIVDDNGVIKSTPDRNFLWNAQTPQIFEYDLIYALHQKYENESFTDDSLLCEKAGIPVFITEGEYSNIKITTENDVKTLQNVNI